MTAIQWDRKFDLGHPRIDSEHRAFLDLIRALSRVDGETADRPKVLRQMKEIRKYAEFHFVSEENMMEETGYPDLARHRREHSIFLAQLGEQAYDYQSGILRVEKIVDFLFGWFSLHTAQEDSSLATHLAGAPGRCPPVPAGSAGPR